VSPRAAVADALARLDARLAREVRRLRLRYQLTLDEFRGLYVSDEQVDALLATQAGYDHQGEPVAAFAGHQALSRLATQFDLSRLAQEVLLLAAAPDLDPKYAPIIAYLNDDVSMRWPTFDLARRLFAIESVPDSELAVLLSACGPLFCNHLITLTNDRRVRYPVPLTAFAAAPAIADYLLGRPPRLAEGLRFVQRSRDPAGQAPDLADLAPLLASSEGRPLVLLQGEWGSGREAAAIDLANELGFATLRLDLKRWQAEGAVARWKMRS
jgi:hypothetical protein